MPKIIIKSVIMNKPDVNWYQLTNTYNDYTMMMIKNLYIICLTRHPGWKEIHTVMYWDLTIHTIHNIISLQFVLQMVSNYE